MTAPDTAIVLAAGGINLADLPIATNTSMAMVPVNGRPVIAWILDDLLSKGLRDVRVVVRDTDEAVQGFLARTFAKRMPLAVVPVDPRKGSVVHSLAAGLAAGPAGGLVRVVLGDTLIRDAFDSREDFVYVGPVEDSRRWCLAVLGSDGSIADYLDKREGPPGDHLALAGYYSFVRGDELLDAVETTLLAGERELSAVLRRYGARHPIRTRRAEQWFDFGHVDHLADARRRLLQPRWFNAISADPVLGTLTKRSRNQPKLEDELAWYLGLPEELQVLTPRVFGRREADGTLAIVVEHYGYPTLAELYVYGELHPDSWASILRRVLRVHQELAARTGTLPEGAIRSMYAAKTFDRLDALRDDPAWAAILDADEIEWNGRPVRGLRRLRPAIEARAAALEASARPAIVHGDYCFSNILFDVSAQIVRLIDPRGSFGVKGIHGDPRYDVAKLRHSVSGLYDFLVADLFAIEAVPGGFRGEIHAPASAGLVAEAFDRQVAALGYDLDDIRFVEGLLFLSMPPLHAGHPDRQRMMYVRGLTLLDEVLP
jgi:dTDP-glucose pyrophosphorylase